MKEWHLYSIYFTKFWDKQAQNRTEIEIDYLAQNNIKYLVTNCMCMTYDIVSQLYDYIHPCDVS